MIETGKADSIQSASSQASPMAPQSYGGPCSFHALSTLIQILKDRGKIDGTVPNTNFLLTNAVSLPTLNESTKGLINYVSKGLLPNGLNNTFVTPSGVSSFKSISDQLSKLSIKNEILNLDEETLVALLKKGEPLLVGYFPAYPINTEATGLREIYNSQMGDREFHLANNTHFYTQSNIQDIVGPHYAILTGIEPKYVNGKIDPVTTMIDIQESAEVKDGILLKSTLGKISLQELLQKSVGANPLSEVFGFSKENQLTALRILPDQKIKSFSLKESARLTLSTETGGFATEGINGFGNFFSGLSLGVAGVFQLPEGSIGIHLKEKSADIHFNSKNHVFRLNIGKHESEFGASTNGSVLGLPRDRLLDLRVSFSKDLNTTSGESFYDNSPNLVQIRREYLSVDLGVSKNSEGFGVGYTNFYSSKYQNVNYYGERKTFQNDAERSYYRIFYRKDSKDSSFRIGLESTTSRDFWQYFNGPTFYVGFSKKM